MSESVPPGPDQYNQDGLITIHNHDFMKSPTFKAAYQRMVLAAGFSSCKLVPYVFPSGLAIVGERE